MDRSKILRIGLRFWRGGVALLFFILFLSLFFFTFYLHEAGHVIFGFSNDLLQGKISSFAITSHVNHPFLPFIHLPQQTRALSGVSSLNFAMGGPIFNILIFLGISFIAFQRSGKKFWFLLFLSVLVFEVSGNIVCGTDNFVGNPLSICNHQLDLVIQLLSTALFASTLTYALMSNKTFMFNLEKLILGHKTK
jgi:hypothetical protein